MKIKNDFVTNSSSCSYVIKATANFLINNRSVILGYEEEDVTTYDIITKLEDDLKDILLKEKSKPDTISIIYNQKVSEYFGDGWCGDPMGVGYIFLGDPGFLKLIMNKENKEISFYNNKIIFPEIWIVECDPEMRENLQPIC